MRMAQVISLPDGQALLHALSDAAPGGGWWQASGFVEQVELRVAGDGADLRRMLRGRHTLVSLSGPVGGPYSALLARNANGGFELAAGELLSARSAGVRALWVPALTQGEEPEFEDAAEPAKPSGASARATREPAAAPAAGASSSWAAQAAAAASAKYVDEDEEEAGRPERGDLVHHFAFGWCEVLIADGDRLKLRDLQGPGRIREIAIDRLDVKGPSEKDGKRAFKLTRRG